MSGHFIEYRVKPVERYVITRHAKSSANPNGITENIVEVPNRRHANELAASLAAQDRTNYPLARVARFKPYRGTPERADAAPRNWPSPYGVLLTADQLQDLRTINAVPMPRQPFRVATDAVGRSLEDHGCITEAVIAGQEVWVSTSRGDTVLTIEAERLKQAQLLHIPFTNERDEDGGYTHPGLPHAEESDDVAAILKHMGFGYALMFMEGHAPELHERYCETGDLDALREWLPVPPAGDGWVLASIHDTEDDGPVALFVRHECSHVE